MKLRFGIILTVLLTWVPVTLAEPQAGIIFIVNINNPASEVTLNDIRDYYFKKKRQWSNGENVRFIDRNLESYLHDIFVKTILRRSNSDVELYWIGQKLYTGDSAPLRKTSDRGTVEFVATFNGGIGYISAPFIAENDLSALKVKVIKAVDTKKD